MDSAEATKLALQHSRELFIYHAGQRIQSLNFYFVAVAVFLGGFGILITSKVEPGGRALFGIVLAFAGTCITNLFQALDKCNEQLVHCDELLLKCAEGKMETITGTAVPEWKLTEGAEEA